MPSTSLYVNSPEPDNIVTLRGKIITVLALAWPAVIESALQTLVGFVDMLFISKLGLVAVSAVGLTQTILQVYYAIFMAIGVASTSLIARHVGSNNLVKARQVATQSVLAACLVGLIFGVVTLFFAKPILQAAGAKDPILLEQALCYLRIVAIPSIIISLTFVLGALLRGAGDTVSPMKAGFWVNVIHVVLDYIFIFGLGPLPGFGIAGAAVATVVARLGGVLLLFKYLNKSSLSIGYPVFRGWNREPEILRAIAAIGTPAAIERLIMRFGQVFYFGLILTLGTYTFAAHQIAGNIESFSYLPGYGFAVAATTLVGQYLGAGQKKEAFVYGCIAVSLAMVFMGAVGVFLYIGGEWAARFFTHNATVIQQVGVALKINAFTQIPLAVVLVLTGALNGLGDTKWPMVSTAVGIWIVRVIGIYLLAVVFGLGLAGVWLAILLDNLWRAIFLGWRFYTNFRTDCF